MKKWKIIFTISIIFLSIFLIYVGSMAVKCFSTDVSYPHSAWGVDLNNWVEEFFMNLVLLLYIFGIPLIIDVILLIISIVKMKKIK